MIKRLPTQHADPDFLIEGCLKGERDAQNRLYGIFSPKMLNVCFRYSKNREEAEDTLVTGFMKVFENLHRFKREGSLEGWIRKIMVNTAIEKYRKQSKRHRMVSLGEIREFEFSEENILNDMNTRDLTRLVQTLPPGYQMVFNLYVFEGLKHREIAQQLGISEGTSKSNLHDARAILKREITASFTELKAANA
jgi:RNA polymerase sigma-70 factor (ECF subfamily)